MIAITRTSVGKPYPQEHSRIRVLETWETTEDKKIIHEGEHVLFGETYDELEFTLGARVGAEDVMVGETRLSRIRRDTNHRSGEVQFLVFDRLELKLPPTDAAVHALVRELQERKLLPVYYEGQYRAHHDSPVCSRNVETPKAYLRELYVPRTSARKQTVSKLVSCSQLSSLRYQIQLQLRLDDHGRHIAYDLVTQCSQLLQLYVRVYGPKAYRSLRAFQEIVDTWRLAPQANYERLKLWYGGPTSGSDYLLVAAMLQLFVREAKRKPKPQKRPVRKLSLKPILRRL